MTIKTDIQRQVSEDRRRARNKRYADKQKRLHKKSDLYKRVKKREKEEQAIEDLRKEREDIKRKVEMMRNFPSLKVETL